MSAPEMTPNEAKLKELVAVLQLERTEPNQFIGQSQDLGWGTVFGGQVVGQALSAATQTVPIDRLVHSLHGYFLYPGKVDQPITYAVHRIRDSRSFNTRRVVATQAGRTIFNLSASFQGLEEGFDHAMPMPDVQGPEQLETEQALALRNVHRIPKALHQHAFTPRAIEIRPINPVDPVQPQPRPATRATWYRANGPLPDDPALHRTLLAYASDFHFFTTAMYPHGVSWLTPGMQVASMDHALWIHRPFRMDQWLLHVVDSPSASGARGFVRGLFYNQAGELVASTAQEGLMRRRQV